MFDIGVTELLVIAVVAIVVVGPKELPRMLRTIGQVVSKAKGMAREFQNQFEEAAQESGITEIQEDIQKLDHITEDMGFDGAFDDFKEAGDELKASVTVPDESAAVKKTPQKTPKKTPRKTAAKTATKKPTTKKAAAKKPATKSAASKKAKPARTPRAAKTKGAAT